MKNLLESSIDMVRVAISVCEKNSEAIASVPALNDAFTRLKAKMAELDTTIKDQIAVISGNTKAKKESKAGLVNIAGTVVQAILAYGHSTNNLALEKEVHFSNSTLLRMGDEELVHTGYNIHTKAIEYQASIAGFGVDTATIDKLLAAIHDYELKCHVPHEAIETRKTSTHKLEVLVHEVKDLLNNELDRLIRILPGQYADFKETYHNVRFMVNHHGKSKTVEPPPVQPNA